MHCWSRMTLAIPSGGSLDRNRHPSPLHHTREMQPVSVLKVVSHKNPNARKVVAVP
jgi:hypothetical protein